MGGKAVQDPDPRVIQTPGGRWVALMPLGQSQIGVFGDTEEEARERLHERLRVWGSLAEDGAEPAQAVGKDAETPGQRG